MSGLGGLNKSPNGVVIGLVQLQLPVVETPEQLRAQAERIVAMVGKARRNNAGLDLVVFPEYALHGLSMSTAPELMCRMDGPEVAAFKAACIEHRVWGCFSLMEFNPNGNPYNTGIMIDDHGAGRALLPQAPSVGAGRGLGAGQLRHPGDRRPEGLQARADHLPRRHVPGDGARVRLQGRRDHAAHRRLHRADPPRLEDHEPGQRVPEPDGDRQRLPVRQRRQLRLDGRRHGLQLRRHRDGRGLRPARRDHHLRGAARPGARGAHALGGREQPVPALAPRLRRGEGRRDGLPVHVHARHGERHASGCRGKPRSCTPTARSCGFAPPTRTHDAGNRLAEAAAAIEVPRGRTSPHASPCRPIDGAPASRRHSTRRARPPERRGPRCSATRRSTPTRTHGRTTATCGPTTPRWS